MPIKKIGDTIEFGRRRGEVIGYTVAKRRGYKEEPQTFYVVELLPEYQSYLEPQEGYAPDCFISVMLVHVSNVRNNPEGS